MSEESVPVVATQEDEPSPTSPEAICAVLAYCAGETGSAVAQLLKAHGEDPAAFEQSLFDSVLLRVLTAPHHQRLCSTAGMLRELAGAVVQVKNNPEMRPLREQVVLWLLDANGGSDCGARDTGVRWRTCILLGALLQSPPVTHVGSQSTRVEDKHMLPELVAAVGEYLLLHVRDRSADVRHAAVEGLDVIKLKLDGADEAVAERAVQDCDAHVRAASVRALVTCSDTIPKDAIAHARLDCAPRVRRWLVRALEEKIRDGNEQWKSVWPATVLSSLGDRSSGIRAAAIRCLQAGTVGGWLKPLLSHSKLAEDMAGHLTVAASALLQRESDDSTRLSEQLAPEPALLAISSGTEEHGASAAILARVALGAKAGSADAADAAAVVPALMTALINGDAAEVRQMLLGCLIAEIPLSTAAQSELTKAATATLFRTPVADAAQGLLGKGALAPQFLGAAGEAAPHNIGLAMLLLRRVATYSAGRQRQQGLRASTQEALFSKAALNAIRGIMQQLEKAEQTCSQCQQDAESAHRDLHALRYQRRARFGAHAPESCDQKNIEKKITDAEAAVASAKKSTDDWNLRVVLAASAWIQYTRMGASQQAQTLLDEVLRPALTGVADQGYVTPVAAVMGIAVHASKNEDAALVHWAFFEGLLEAQIKRLRQPAASALSEGSPLCVAARYAEIATLFMCDSVLLHDSAMGEERIGGALIMFTRALTALDEGASQVYGLADLMQHLAHLRAVICDRVACLAMMGKLQGNMLQAQWLIARFLVDLCGPSISEVVHPDDATTKVTYAVAGGRMLRFIAMLPLTSLAHAELLVSAMESFFAARMWMDIPQGRGTSNRASPAVRLTRLVCARLRFASSAASTTGDADAEQSSTSNTECALYVKMQVRAICAIAAALLAAPAIHAPMLRDAFAAGILTSAVGGPPFAWAGEDSAGLATAAASLLGRAWTPATAAKSVEALLAEVRSLPCAADAGAIWAQEAVERAADLRLDFASIGLLNPGLGLGSAVATARGPWRGQEGTLPCVAEAIRGSLPQQRQPAVMSKLEWQLVDVATSESLQVPDGETITIGRHPLCDIVINAVVVSGKHCSVTSAAGDLEVQDLGGRNGTYVNDVRLSPQTSRMKLNVGDVLAIAGQLGPRFQVKQCHIASVSTLESTEELERTQEARPGLLVTKRSFGVLPAEANPPSEQISQREEVCDDESQPESNAGSKDAMEEGDGVEDEDFEESMGKGQEEPASPARKFGNSEEKVTPLPRRIADAGQGERLQQDQSAQTNGTCNSGAACLTPGKLSPPPRFQSKRKATEDEEEALRQLHTAKKAKTETTRPEEADTVLHASETPLPTMEEVAEKVVAAMEDGAHSGPCLIDLVTGKTSWLPIQGAVAVGRMGDCQVVVRGPQVSSRHCMVLITDGQATLEDMSSNGTYINDTKVPKGFALPQQVPLRHGDRISLASCDGPSFLFLATADLREDQEQADSDGEELEDDVPDIS